MKKVSNQIFLLQFKQQLFGRKKVNVPSHHCLRQAKPVFALKVAEVAFSSASQALSPPSDPVM